MDHGHHDEELRRIYQRRLNALEKQAALKGLNTPPEVHIEIEELRDKLIRRGPQRDASAQAPTLPSAHVPSLTLQQRRWPKFLLPLSVVVGLIVLASIWYLRPPEQASVPCYNGGVTITGTIPAHGVVYTEEFRTSARCLDINVKFSVLSHPTAIIAVRCDTLNDLTSEKEQQIAASEDYAVVASNLLDTTCFKLRLRGDQGSPYTYVGVVAY